MLWETAEVARAPPSVPYDEVMQSEAGVLRWLSEIVRGLLGSANVTPGGADTGWVGRDFQAKWGFCLVQGVPPTPAATEELAKRVTFIRPTIFGMRSPTPKACVGPGAPPP